MELIVQCNVLWLGQPISPPSTLARSGARNNRPDEPCGSVANDPLRSPHALARMWSRSTPQFGPSQIARYPNAIEALLELKTFELRYNSLDRAVERLSGLREVYQWHRNLDHWAGSGWDSVNPARA